MTKNKQSILIVDDSKIALEFMYRALSQNYLAHKAESADDAFKILQDKHIDLVLSDYNMPVKTGLQLFAEVDKNFPGVGKVLITAFSDADVVVEAINSGSVDKCIKKPWNSKLHLPIIQDSLVAVEEKRLESQMIQNSKLASIGELAAGIVHEINNPLTFIDVNLTNLNKFFRKIIGLFDSYDDMDIPKEIKEEIKKRKEAVNYDYLNSRIIEMIEKSKGGTDRIKKIITSMKTLSRQSEFEFEEANIEEALDTTLNLLVHEYKNRIKINKDYGNIPDLKCNITKLSQVFMNLLVNACHAIKEKGEIKITTCAEADMAVIKISDTGEGIPEKIKNQLFESFFTTKPTGKGTGLGLSISQRIIEQHNGKIVIDSKVGEGTTFTVKIPTTLKAEDMKE